MSHKQKASTFSKASLLSQKRVVVGTCFPENELAFETNPLALIEDHHGTTYMFSRSQKASSFVKHQKSELAFRKDS